MVQLPFKINQRPTALMSSIVLILNGFSTKVNIFFNFPLISPLNSYLNPSVSVDIIKNKLVVTCVIRSRIQKFTA